MSKKGRILSGMQPTGRLHLGNYEGALKNWVRLQDDYEMFCLIVDWHALTTNYDDTGFLRDGIRELAIDYISAGLDLQKCTIFVQSQIKEQAELHLLLSMITPIPWLERNPTYKEKVKELNLESSVGYGLLGYPVLQAADILIYKADLVPVGRDQLPHLELTREIARRFNSLYGPVFPEPEVELTKYSILPGIDGRKMSKSYDNCIYMADEPELIRQKVSQMFTDPGKIYKTDPGHPEECPVYYLHQIYNPDHQEILEPCKMGDERWGCVRCKQELAEHMSAALGPIRKRRHELESVPERIDQILKEGAERARVIARQTMSEVREAMGLID